MDDCIDSIGNAEVFSTSDANCGYWKIQVSVEDQDKSCFTLHMGTYWYKLIPFGLRNSRSTFQRGLYIILSGVRWQTCLVYLDDVIMFFPSFDHHADHLYKVLALIELVGVSRKLIKCAFFREKVDYLGHTIMSEKIITSVYTTSGVL